MHPTHSKRRPGKSVPTFSLYISPRPHIVWYFANLGNFPPNQRPDVYEQDGVNAWWRISLALQVILLHQTEPRRTLDFVLPIHTHCTIFSRLYHDIKFDFMFESWFLEQTLDVCSRRVDRQRSDNRVSSVDWRER